MIFTAPGTYNVTGVEGILIGGTFERLITVPYNLAGYSARWFAKNHPLDTTYIFDYLSSDVSPKITITPGASSTIRLKIPASVTSSFSPKTEGYHELRLSTGSDITVVFAGAIDFIKSFAL